MTGEAARRHRAQEDTAHGAPRRERDSDDETPEIASLTGVPEGVGPPVNADCPICTGGRGIVCSWH